MIDVTSLKTEPAQTSSAALPRFGRLTGVACLVGLVPAAGLMIAGRATLAGSVLLGVGMSLGVCGLLFLFVERVMPMLAGRASSSMSAQGSQLQFLLLLGAKLAFIALVGAAFLTLHHVNSIAVLVGFLLGQTAIIVSALRYRKI